MTILAVDTFIRANQSGFGTSSGGQVWTAPRGSGTYSITSNEGVNSTNGANFSVARLGSGTATSVEVLIRLKPADTTSNIGTVARYVDINNFYYGVLVGGVARIGKDVSGTFTTLASTSVTYTASNFYWLRFNLVSTTLRLKFWQDGSGEPSSWTVTTTDASLSSGGYGLGSDATGNTSFDGMTVTNAPGTRTITPVTSALKTTNTRTVPDTTALKTTNTRTIGVTAATQTTSTRTISATSALKTTNIRTIPVSVALKTTQARTIPDTAALKTTNARTITQVSTALKTTNTRTIGSNAALLTTNTKTITPVGAVLEQTSKKTLSATAALQTTNTRTIPTTGAMLTRNTRTIEASAALVKMRSIPCSACLSNIFIFEPNAMLIVPSGTASLLVPSGQTTLIVPSGQTTLIIP